MRRTRKGFTLVELLIVITIIAILIGLVATGLSLYSQRTKVADTRTVLQNLQAMLADYRGDLLPANAPLQLNAATIDASKADTDLAIAQTAMVMKRLQSIPGNKKAWDAFPSDRLQKTANGWIILDSWERPIIFVPGGDPNDLQKPNGLTAVSGSGTIRSPNGRPFFFSAGPDQDYRTGSDNIYSFQN